MIWLLVLLHVCLHLLLFHFASFHSLCHPHDSYALLQFKTSFTVDYQVSICNGHANPKTATWKNETDCCSWLGVTCHPISGHVIGLDLSCSGLFGEIHPNSTLFRLFHLQVLNLAFNDFSQSPLSSHFGEFASLTHLNLSNCDIEGEIPIQISHLSKLSSLDLSSNFHQLKWKEMSWKRLLQNATVLRELVLDDTDMSSTSLKPLNLSSSLVTLSLVDTQIRGKLTNDILCLPNLKQLHLSNNVNLKGKLPKLSCSIASSLSILDLKTCHFEGSIPSSFSNLNHLTSLDLSSNNLTGSIPSSLFTLPQLTFLHLNGNNLSGQIPNVFHYSNTFQEIDLSENHIGGDLPSSLSNLQHLIHLDISKNEFSGQIPDMFGGLLNLETFSVSHNKLEGPLPTKITGLSNLTTLYLFNNLLNETIPSWCLSLPSLMDLDLSTNHFTGHISEISSYSLESLDLSNNKLHGNIPLSVFSLANLSDLDLSSNNLSGSVHFPLFSKLQHLTSLSLSHNTQLSLNFTSDANNTFSRLIIMDLSSTRVTEFPNLFGKFPSLVYLDMSNSRLTGKMPNWLHEMSSLNYLDLSFNLLAGDISSSICNASSLRILNLSHNNLTGTIPQCLTNLSFLSVLDLQMNKLYGTLPNTFSDNLAVLNLNDNQLESLFPQSLSNCIELKVLNLGNNQIEDTFPHWLQTLPSLEVLVLRANRLHGPIASLKTNHSFPSLIIFDISSNNFSGPIPKAYIKNLKAMKIVIPEETGSRVQYMEIDLIDKIYIDSVSITTKAINMNLLKIPINFVHIDLSKNKFEGEIPNIIGELYALKGLNLSHNRLNGSIPQSLGNLTNLESLDLSSNMLIGRIPEELINLNFLEVLNLSQNHLVGEIPQGKQFNTFSNDSYEGNLGLCGLPLSKKCRNTHEQQSPPLSTMQHEQKFGFGWKPVAIGYGCGMVFGMGIGYCVLLIGKPEWLVRMVGGRPNKRVKRRN
ncbi:receptor-like protein 6 [Abrus precatorius]|uniref:Receptor-like protein 6 n=1 Tax=Abrus precatorius TaxID=3816 RepID=A0A8B8MLW6_ABRPR|nr:receptor-like protein 6 [Abrus precatorius]